MILVGHAKRPDYGGCLAMVIVALTIVFGYVGLTVLDDMLPDERFTVIGSWILVEDKAGFMFQIVNTDINPGEIMRLDRQADYFVDPQPFATQ